MNNGTKFSETIAKIFIVFCLICGFEFGWKGVFYSIIGYFIGIFLFGTILKLTNNYDKFINWCNKHEEDY